MLRVLPENILGYYEKCGCKPIQRNFFEYDPIKRETGCCGLSAYILAGDESNWPWSVDSNTLLDKADEIFGGMYVLGFTRGFDLKPIERINDADFDIGYLDGKACAAKVFGQVVK